MKNKIIKLKWNIDLYFGSRHIEPIYLIQNNISAFNLKEVTSKFNQSLFEFSSHNLNLIARTNQGVFTKMNLTIQLKWNQYTINLCCSYENYWNEIEKKYLLILIIMSFWVSLLDTGVFLQYVLPMRYLASVVGFQVDLLFSFYADQYTGWGLYRSSKVCFLWLEVYTFMFFSIKAYIIRQLKKNTLSYIIASH